ncbi:unnamed protein product [Rhizoctonia solani]|uniref:CHAT domain-containing protein n=1 Tax=Rhizoctonia solani TaxID=456999 RepID=A0A8H2XU88_9AGAM|nr:unnamed protein product [Rhizoctonia solani]
MPRKLEDLDKEIAHLSLILSQTPNHPNLALLLTYLGASHEERFNHLGEADDIEKAVKYASTRLTLTPDDDSSLPGVLDALGRTHDKRFKRLGEVNDLAKAIEYKSRALSLTPDGHSDLPFRSFSLGVSHGIRFQRLGEPGDIENVIKYTSRAVDLTSDDDPDMSTWLANLGMSHSERYKCFGELNDLDKGIEYETRALALTPSGHPDLSRRLANIAVSHSDRFNRLGELKDLSKAIEYSSSALALIPNGHPDLPNRLTNLGASHAIRFNHLGELEDLEKAIEYGSRAVSSTPDGHPDLSRRLANLGLSHLYRFRHLNEVGDIDKAIEYESRALALTPDNHPGLSTHLNNLGITHPKRFHHLGKLYDLTMAVDYQSRALALTPDGHPQLPIMHLNLALLYSYQTQHTGDFSHLQNSLEHFRTATRSTTGGPRTKFQCALTWTKITSQFSSSLSPLEAYQTAINLLPEFIWLGATSNQRYEHLKTVESLAVGAGSAAILSGDYALALEWLEHARCVVWNQSLMLRSPLDELQSSHPALATRIQTLANMLHSAGSESRESQVLSASPMDAEHVAQKHRRLAEEYYGLLSQARSLPGFDDFLRPTKATVLAGAAQNGPIVVINCHEDHCDALLILPGQSQIRHVPLPNFNGERAQWARSRIEASLRRKNLRERGVKIKQEPGRKDEFGTVLKALWNDIIKPILDFLGFTNNVPTGTLPHITWCPTGALSFLPLHAAGDYDQIQPRVFDYVISSYTPTLTALLSYTTSILNCDSRMLAIGMKHTPRQKVLHGTVKELAHIQGHVPGTVQYTQLVDSQATTMAVLDAMHEHNWVHLACHAHQNVSDPTKSGFFLHDGTLDLAAINQRSFKNKGLAFLSACQTATGDETLPDEAIHLASGMLMAGYPSVIATMWSVVDEDAPFVADKVYGKLMKAGSVGNGEAGKALHHAVAALREKVGEKEFGRWVPYIHIGS